MHRVAGETVRTVSPVFFSPSTPDAPTTLRYTLRAVRRATRLWRQQTLDVRRLMRYPQCTWPRPRAWTHTANEYRLGRCTAIVRGDRPGEYAHIETAHCLYIEASPPYFKTPPSRARRAPTRRRVLSGKGHIAAGQVVREREGDTREFRAMGIAASPIPSARGGLKAPPQSLRRRSEAMTHAKTQEEGGA